jgi:hypothetical protein
MRAILIIGWKSATSAPEGLYCGLDGVKAMAVAEKARESGKFFALRHIAQLETVGRPLPVVPLAAATGRLVVTDAAPEVATVAPGVVATVAPVAAPRTPAAKAKAKAKAQEQETADESTE